MENAFYQKDVTCYCSRLVLNSEMGMEMKSSNPMDDDGGPNYGLGYKNDHGI
jgi:hypothetical protein